MGGIASANGRRKRPRNYVVPEEEPLFTAVNDYLDALIRDVQPAEYSDTYTGKYQVSPIIALVSDTIGNCLNRGSSWSG